MKPTNEQIEQYRAIVEGAPEKSLTHHDGNHYWQYTNENCWCRYCNPIAKLVVGEPSSKNKSLDNLRTIIAQHDEIERLRGLIKKHNDECEALCQPEQCGYAQYKRDCPNCTKSMLIDMEALSNE